MIFKRCVIATVQQCARAGAFYKVWISFFASFRFPNEGNDCQLLKGTGVAASGRWRKATKLISSPRDCHPFLPMSKGQSHKSLCSAWAEYFFSRDALDAFIYSASYVNSLTHGAWTGFQTCSYMAFITTQSPPRLQPGTTPKVQCLFFIVSKYPSEVFHSTPGPWLFHHTWTSSLEPQNQWHFQNSQCGSRPNVCIASLVTLTLPMWQNHQPQIRC